VYKNNKNNKNFNKILIRKMKLIDFRNRAFSAELSSVNYSLLNERVDYAYSLKRVNRFGDFLLEGRVIELDIQKDKNIFRCKMSIDPMGVKWVDFSDATYFPKLSEVFLIRTRRWNCRVVSWRSFVWDQFAIKRTKKLQEAEQREIKKNMSAYYEEYGHYELLDSRIQGAEDALLLEGEIETSYEKLKKFRIKNKPVTGETIYTFKKKKKNPFGCYKKSDVFFTIFNTHNARLFFKQFLLSIRSRRLVFPRARSFSFPRAGITFFLPRSISGVVKHNVLGLSGFVKIYNTVLLQPEFSLLHEEILHLKHTKRKQVALNSFKESSFFADWLSWNLLFLTKTFIKKGSPEQTKHVVYSLAAKISQIRVYNKLSQILQTGTTSLNYYDLLRHFVALPAGSAFETHVLGCVLNPENDDLRSQLSFGYYPSFTAQVTIPKHKKVARPAPVLTTFNKFSRVLGYRAGLRSIQYKIVLLLRKELMTTSWLHKFLFNRKRNMSFRWVEFLGSMLKRLASFNLTKDNLLLQRAKHVNQDLLDKIFYKKLDFVSRVKAYRYVGHNKQFFSSAIGFFTDLELFNEVVLKQTTVKRSRAILRFRTHGVAVDSVQLESGIVVLDRDMFLASADFLREVISARTQFCMFGNPRKRIQLLQQRQSALLSDFYILDNVISYKRAVLRRFSLVSSFLVQKKVASTALKVKKKFVVQAHKKKLVKKAVKVSSNKVTKISPEALKKLTKLLGGGRKKRVVFGVGTKTLKPFFKLLKKKIIRLSKVSKLWFCKKGKVKSRGANFSAYRIPFVPYLNQTRLIVKEGTISIVKRDFSALLKTRFYSPSKGLLEPSCEKYLYLRLLFLDRIAKEKREVKEARKQFFKKKYAKRYMFKKHQKFQKNKNYENRRFNNRGGYNRSAYVNNRGFWNGKGYSNEKKWLNNKPYTQGVSQNSPRSFVEGRVVHSSKNKLNYLERDNRNHNYNYNRNNNNNNNNSNNNNNKFNKGYRNNNFRNNNQHYRSNYNDTRSYNRGQHGYSSNRFKQGGFIHANNNGYNQSDFSSKYGSKVDRYKNTGYYNKTNYYTRKKNVFFNSGSNYTKNNKSEPKSKYYNTNKPVNSKPVLLSKDIYLRSMKQTVNENIKFEYKLYASNLRSPLHKHMFPPRPKVETRRHQKVTAGLGQSTFVGQHYRSNSGWRGRNRHNRRRRK
jgi:hypothetical protein